MSVGGDHSKRISPLVKPTILIHFDRDFSWDLVELNVIDDVGIS